MKVNSEMKSCNELRVGDEFVLEKEIDKYRGIYFTGATGEYHPIYIDESLARALDFPSTPLPLSFLSSVVGAFLIQWTGSPECLRSICLRMKKDLFAGNLLRIKGKVVKKEKGYVKLVFSLTNERGEKLCSECWAELELRG